MTPNYPRGRTTGRQHPATAARLSDTLSRIELIVDANDMARHDFLINPNGVRAIVDTVIVACLQKYEERFKTDEGPETQLSTTIPGLILSRPDVFLRQLGRTGAIGISYLTLYEALDPKKPTHNVNGKPLIEPLDQASRRVMFERIDRLKRYNIRVVDVSSRAFRTALDMWFDARQGRIPRKHDPLLADPIIAATAMATGAQLYSPNRKDFEPFSQQYELNFAPVIQDGNYLGLPIAA